MKANGSLARQNYIKNVNTFIVIAQCTVKRETHRSNERSFMKPGSSLALLGARPLVYPRHVCVLCVARATRAPVALPGAALRRATASPARDPREREETAALQGRGNQANT